MTRDEILNMPVGEEINAMVAEQVLGWKLWAEKRGEYTYCVWQKPKEREPWFSHRNWKVEEKRYAPMTFTDFDPHRHVLTGVLKFSADISAAWHIVSVVGNWHGFDFMVLKRAAAEGWEAGWYEWFGDDYESRAAAEAPTPALAICRAALLTATP